MTKSLLSLDRSVFVLGVYVALASALYFKFNPFTQPEPRKSPSEIALCSAVSASQATIQSKSHTGTVTTPVGSTIGSLKKWSSTATWEGNNKPGANDDVLIPANSVVVLDQNITVKSITVEGKLIVDLSKDITVNTEFIIVNGVNGYFEWGTPDSTV